MKNGPTQLCTQGLSPQNLSLVVLAHTASNKCWGENAELWVPTPQLCRADVFCDECFQAFPPLFLFHVLLEMQTQNGVGMGMRLTVPQLLCVLGQSIS